ncbi:MAG: hypothetical protein KIC37_08025 [Coriobacteriaceae bacterium]|nr:hypothetical protein [Coriobacteriaceae bacterium]
MKNKTIGSITEFKQTLGRGIRIKEHKKVEDAFYHPMNKGGKGTQRLFDGNIGRGSRQNLTKLKNAAQKVTIRNEIALFPGIEEASGADEGIFVRFVGKTKSTSSSWVPETRKASRSLKHFFKSITSTAAYPFFLKFSACSMTFSKTSSSHSGG